MPWQVLGQGGFGITYKALQVELNRSVVIKTPNEFLSHDPEYDRYVERFIQEGQILARLSQEPHPHIVGVIDLFQEGATHCLVMNFVAGENLFEVVKRRGALPEDEILPCICQIAAALTVVHKAGLVHRDAHPGNIMLGSDGKAVLIDFGIAKGIEPQTLSSTGNVGNRGFAPYEQMTRGSREPTVDIYCLAATLYYVITGQSPTTSLARKLDNASLVAPKQHNRAISQRLNRAILKGMALEAEDRPQSMQAWLAMLEAPKATPPPPVEPVYGKEVVRPEIKLKPPDTKSNRIIPWGWLVTVLSYYMSIGYLLTAAIAPLFDWAMTLAFALLGAGAGAEAREGAWALALAGAWALTGKGVWALALGWVRAGAGVVVVLVVVVVFWVVVGAGAVKELGKSFSTFHTFLILAGTSGLGLGLGWLLTKVYAH